MLCLLGLAVIGAFIQEETGIAPCNGLSGVDYETCINPAYIDGAVEKNKVSDTTKLSESKREKERARIAAEKEAARLEEIRQRQIENERLRPIRALNGNWNDGMGTLYAMRVDDNGVFSGTGMSMDGYPLTLSGKLTGATGSYTIAASSMGISYQGTLKWDYSCHIDYATYYPNGQIGVQGKMHVNHYPGDPCP